MEAMMGRIEIGFVVAGHAFGEQAAEAMGVVLSLMLISTVSAMILAGPRVLQVIGEDFSAFRFLAGVRNGVPVKAIIFQSTLTILFIVTGSFESILIFSGFVLGINTLFAVLGVYVLRYRKIGEDSRYRTFGYPFTPAIYLSITLWTLIYILINRPQEAWVGLGLILVGCAVYYATTRGKFGLSNSRG